MFSAALRTKAPSAEGNSAGMARAKGAITRQAMKELNCIVKGLTWVRFKYLSDETARAVVVDVEQSPRRRESVEAIYKNSLNLKILAISRRFTCNLFITIGDAWPLIIMIAAPWILRSSLN